MKIKVKCEQCGKQETFELKDGQEKLYDFLKIQTLFCCVECRDNYYIGN
jgi:hypothetical protein